MTQRETWEEVSFQVFTDESGVLRSGYYPTGTGLVTGNVKVDRVWGNVPMQPDDDRANSTSTFGGGAYDVGWTSTTLYNSAPLQASDYTVGTPVQNLFTLKVPADSHIIATTSYEGFPEFTTGSPYDDTIANVAVPNVVGSLLATAQSTLTTAGLTNSSSTTYVGATTVNDGKVKSSTPAATTIVNVGTNVALSVYEAPTVPDVLGDTENDAETALIAAHLVKGTVTTDYVGATTVNDLTVKSQTPVSGGKANTGSSVALVLYAAPTVPDVLGLDETNAETALVAAHLVKGTVTTTVTGATTVNDGLVKSQTPVSGGKANTGSSVALELYAAPTVPDVLGLTEAAAETALTTANLVKGTVTTSTDGATAENDGLVKSQTPISGGKANTGSAVDLVLFEYIP